MKRSFIISTIFFLCAFFLISTAEAITATNPLTVDYVHRLVVAEGWPEVEGYGYGDEHESYELGNFEFSAYGSVGIEEEWEGEYFYWEEQVTEAYQNSNITIEDNKLVLEGTGYSDDYYWDWDHYNPYYNGYAESSIELNFTIDQNYLLSLTGTLYGYYSSNWGTSSSYFHLYDKDNDTSIIYAAGSDSGTSFDENRILPSGAYSLTIEAYDGSFENINLTLEPVPIPQSFWLLCSGSILILLYARRQVMA